jgi:hypothetical protein
MGMENLIFRGRPDDKNECEQWSLVRHVEDGEDYVVQERVKLDEVLSGRPYMRLVKRMTPSFWAPSSRPQCSTNCRRSCTNGKPRNGDHRGWC